MGVGGRASRWAGTQSKDPVRCPWCTTQRGTAGILRLRCARLSASAPLRMTPFLESTEGRAPARPIRHGAAGAAPSDFLASRARAKNSAAVSTRFLSSALGFASAASARWPSAILFSASAFASPPTTCAKPRKHSTHGPPTFTSFWAVPSASSSASRSRACATCGVASFGFARADHARSRKVPACCSSTRTRLVSVPPIRMTFGVNFARRFHAFAHVF